MLYRNYESEEWQLMPLIATFLQHEKEHEQYAVSEKELRTYEEMGHIDNLEFSEAEYDQEVLDRLSEVKDYPESEYQTVSEYVLENKVLKGTTLETKKQNELLESSILEIAGLLGGEF